MAAKNSESDYSGVLGNFEMSSGKHYWEIKIDSINPDEERGIALGIAQKGIDLNGNICAQPTFYGFLPLVAKKCTGLNSQEYDYGARCVKDDRVGILLEFKNGEGQLQFFKNE